MNPCVGCKKKGQCPNVCKPKADFVRHMKRINRILRRNERQKQVAASC